MTTLVLDSAIRVSWSLMGLDSVPARIRGRSVGGERRRPSARSLFASPPPPPSRPPPPPPLLFLPQQPPHPFITMRKALCSPAKWESLQTDESNGGYGIGRGQMEGFGWQGEYCGCVMDEHYYGSILRKQNFITPFDQSS